MNGIPIVGVKTSDSALTSLAGLVAIFLGPSFTSGVTTTGVDTATVEVFHALTPFDDGETLDGRTSTQNRTLFLRRLERHLDRLRELRQHVTGRHRLDREPLRQAVSKKKPTSVSGTYPTGHQAKTTETSTNTESTLTTELDSD
jgi:hypothetical protein